MLHTVKGYPGIELCEHERRYRTHISLHEWPTF